MMSIPYVFLLSGWMPLYAGLCVVLCLRFWKRAQRTGAQAVPPVTVWPELVCLCPLSAGDPPQREMDRLPAYRGVLRFLFLCAETDLTAQMRAARRMAALQRKRIPAQLVLTTPRGRNPKTSQLAQAPKDILYNAPYALILDGDVQWGSVNATALVRRLITEADLGAVWQASVPLDVQTTRADEAAKSILIASVYAMPFAGLFKPGIAVGKILAMRVRSLQYVGGFGASAHVLGEDLHLSDCLRAMGFRTDCLDHAPAISVRVGQTNRALWQRMVRWHRIVIEQAPTLLWAHPLYIAFWPLQMLAWSLLGFTYPLYLVASGMVAATLLRVCLARLIARLCGRRLNFWQSAKAAVRSDVWLFASFMRALLYNGVRWQGQHVTSGAHARLPQAISRLPGDGRAA